MVLDDLAKSFPENVKKTGESTDPCGIPQGSGHRLDLLLPINADWASKKGAKPVQY